MDVLVSPTTCQVPTYTPDSWITITQEIPDRRYRIQNYCGGEHWSGQAHGNGIRRLSGADGRSGRDWRVRLHISIASAGLQLHVQSAGPARSLSSRTINGADGGLIGVRPERTGRLSLRRSAVLGRPRSSSTCVQWPLRRNPRCRGRRRFESPTVRMPWSDRTTMRNSNADANAHGTERQGGTATSEALWRACGVVAPDVRPCRLRGRGRVLSTNAPRDVRTTLPHAAGTWQRGRQQCVPSQTPIQHGSGGTLAGMLEVSRSEPGVRAPSGRHAYRQAGASFRCGLRPRCSRAHDDRRRSPPRHGNRLRALCSWWSRAFLPRPCS